MLVALAAACSGGDDGRQTSSAAPSAGASGLAMRAGATSTVGVALRIFMSARIAGDDEAVLAALTGEFRRGVEAGLPAGLPLFRPPPGPDAACWYRYEFTATELPPAAATARVRVYERAGAGGGVGDGAGLLSSWAQDVGLVRVGAGWQVESVSAATDRRDEPAERPVAVEAVCGGSGG